MLKTETKEVAGLSVATTQLPAMRAYTLLARLLKIAGPAVAQMGKSSLGEVAAALFSNLDPAEFPAVAREILACTTVTLDGRTVALSSNEAIDTVFNGRLPALIGVLRHALEVNYSGFFDGSLAAVFPGLAPSEASP